MVYLQLKARALLSPGEQLLIRHVADAVGTEGEKLMEMPVTCAATPGVWKLPAAAVVQAALAQCPEISMLGPPECFVHVVPQRQRNRTRPLRAAAAFVLLLVGSALAITGFHADVNMLDAQQGLFRLITGREVENQWLITVPYAVGIFFGVALFYALLGRKGTVSPLEIKLAEYRQSAEQATGKTP